MLPVNIDGTLLYAFSGPMTLAQCREIHEHMWGLLAETGDWAKPVTNVVNNCSACQYAFHQLIEFVERTVGAHEESKNMCEFCPLTWEPYPAGTDHACVSSERTLYGQWLNAVGNEARMEIAGKIRDMWRDQYDKKGGKI